MTNHCEKAEHYVFRDGFWTIGLTLGSWAILTVLGFPRAAMAVAFIFVVLGLSAWFGRLAWQLALIAGLLTDIDRRQRLEERRRRRRRRAEDGEAGEAA